MLNSGKVPLPHRARARFYQFVHQAPAARPAQFTVLRGRVASLENTGVGARPHRGRRGNQRPLRLRQPAAYHRAPARPAPLSAPALRGLGNRNHPRCVSTPNVVEFMDFRGAAAPRGAVHVRATPSARAGRWSSTRFSRRSLWPRLSTKRTFLITWRIR
ncbi:MAG: hypothetical protein WKG07_14060 [Hymenobacter sp.]